MTNETFDPEAAAAELATIGQVADNPRRARLAILQAAALVDIAASLRPIAAEASLAMAGTFGGFEGDADAEDVDGEGEAPDELEHGDLVTIEEDGSPFRIVSFGVDQDEPYAELQDLETGEVRGRVWVRNLTRYVEPDAPGDGEEAPDEKPATPDIADVTDDLDDDFDGDEHAAAEDALAKLAAAEKARKASKKKSGGKKA